MLDAYVITIETRPDRLAIFTARAEAAGLDVKVIYGRHSGPIPERWAGSRQSYYNAEAHRQLLTSTSGDVAVFEDDALLPTNLGERIDTVLRVAPDDWELIALGARVFGYGEQWRAPLHQLGNFCLTHAYLVSDRGRPVAVAAADEALWHWDHMLSRRICHRGKTWMLCPPVMQDGELGSDIPDSGGYRR